MNTKQITTEQIASVKEMAKDFRVENGKETYVYCGTMLNSDYCHFLGLDYATIHLLGEVGYAMTYYKTEDNLYHLACETYIDNTVNDKLSFILEDKEDFLELFEKDRKEDNHDYKASLKEFFDMSTESVIDWIKENEEEVWEGIKESIISNIDSDELDESMKEDIADSWIEGNCDDAFTKVMDSCSSSDLYDYAHEIINRL